jgi:hypothetical protein
MPLSPIQIERNAQFTLGKLIDFNVMEYKADIANISNEATQEAALEDLMQGVRDKVRDPKEIHLPL